jgi:hypothetical protein
MVRIFYLSISSNLYLIYLGTEYFGPLRKFFLELCFFLSKTLGLESRIRRRFPRPDIYGGIYPKTVFISKYSGMDDGSSLGPGVGFAHCKICSFFHNLGHSCAVIFNCRSDHWKEERFQANFFFPYLKKIIGGNYGYN